MDKTTGGGGGGGGLTEHTRCVCHGTVAVVLCESICLLDCEPERLKITSLDKTPDTVHRLQLRADKHTHTHIDRGQSRYHPETHRLKMEDKESDFFLLYKTLTPVTHHQTAALSCILNPLHMLQGFFFFFSFFEKFIFLLPHPPPPYFTTNCPPLVSLPVPPPDLTPTLNPVCLLQLCLLWPSSLLVPTGPITLNHPQSQLCVFQYTQ